MRFTPTCSGADRRRASWFRHPSPCQRAVCVSASKQPGRPGRAHGQPWSQSRGQDSPWGAGAWTCLPPPTLGPTVNTPRPPLPAPQPPRETLRRPPSCLFGPRTRKVLNHAHTQQDVNGQMEKEAEWPHSPQGTQWRDQPLKVFENATPSPLQPQPGRRHRPWLQGVDRTKGAQRKAGPLPTVPSHPQVPPASGHWGGGGGCLTGQLAPQGPGTSLPLSHALPSPTAWGQTLPRPRQSSSSHVGSTSPSAQAPVSRCRRGETPPFPPGDAGPRDAGSAEAAQPPGPSTEPATLPRPSRSQLGTWASAAEAHPRAPPPHRLGDAKLGLQTGGLTVVNAGPAQRDSANRKHRGQANGQDRGQAARAVAAGTQALPLEPVAAGSATRSPPPSP